MDNIKTIDNKLLKSLVARQFPNNKNDPTTDRSYAYLDLKWVEKEAYKGFKAWLSIFDFGKGIHNSDWKLNFDCEDLSISFKIYLRLLHAEANPHTFSERAKGKKNETNTDSVLAGVMFYKNSPRSAHSINVFFDGNNKARFFEPMYGNFMNLTQEQRDSTWYVEF
jgi:hypothetical protein